LYAHMNKIKIKKKMNALLSYTQKKMFGLIWFPTMATYKY
jgi:hypothetical protein